MPTAVSQLSARERLKQHSERNAVFVLVVLGLIYGFFFLPESVLEIFQQRFHQVGGVLAEMGLSAMVAGAIGFIITSQDILATCDLKSSKFFRKQFPSDAIKTNYAGCTQEEADYLWFSLFNPWKETDHPRNQSFMMTFQRGYSCRFLFHARLSLVFFIGLAVMTWVVAVCFGVEEWKREIVFARGLLLFLSFASIVALFGFNRLTPSGCWKRWQEINGINKQWLREAVFSKAKTYAEAVNLLTDSNWRKLYGYK